MIDTELKESIRERGNFVYIDISRGNNCNFTIGEFVMR